MRAWMAAFVLAASMSTAAAADDAPSPIFGHIEFLWEPPVPGTGARPVALGLLIDPDAPHLACWKTQDFPQRAVEVRLEPRPVARRQAGIVRLPPHYGAGAGKRISNLGKADSVAMSCARRVLRSTRNPRAASP